MILESIIPALLPVAADGVRGIFNRLTGGAGAKPANVSEVVTLMGAETERLKALSDIDRAGDVSVWVNNIRALQRPVVSALIVSAYVVSASSGVDEDVVVKLGQYAQMVTFYLFGDRTYTYLKAGK